MSYIFVYLVINVIVDSWSTHWLIVAALLWGLKFRKKKKKEFEQKPKLSDSHHVRRDTNCGYTHSWTSHLSRAVLPLLRGPLVGATSEGSLRGDPAPRPPPPPPPTAGGGWTEEVSRYVWTRALLFWTALWCHGPLRSKPKPSTDVGGAAPAVPLMGVRVWVTPGGELTCWLN